MGDGCPAPERQRRQPGTVWVGLLVLGIAAVVAYRVYEDATGRGRDDAALWALGIGVLTLLTVTGLGRDRFDRRGRDAANRSSPAL